MELNPIKAYMDSLLIENKKYDLNNIEWKPSTDGPKELNPIVYINGKMYRPRVETLVFNKEGKVLCINNTPPTKFGTTYYLPGGGFSKEREPIKQACKECQEEAKINITNIKDTGLVQIADFHGNYPDWHKKKLWPMGIKYEGSVTLIFVADYKSPYKGYIREIDKDDFYKSAKFVDPDEVKWIPEHKQAVEFYRKSLHENVEILDEETSNIMNKITEFYKQLCNYQYGSLVNGRKIINTDDFSDYVTISPEDFHKYKIGICWDYAEAEARFFSKLGFKLALDKSLENNTYSLYFIQYISKNGYNPTHTWLAFKYENKIYTFEVSWYSEKGIKQWNSEKLMLNAYFKKHVNGNHEPENPMKYVMIKYGPRRSFNKTPIQYMNSIYHTGYVIDTNIKEFTTDKHLTLNESVCIEFEPMQTVEIIKENKPTDLEKAKNIGIDISFLESKFLIESVITSKKIKDCETIILQLSKFEKTQTGDTINNLQRVKFLKVEYKKDNPVGFILLKETKESILVKSLYCIMAIIKEERHTNLSIKLIKQAIKWFKNSDYDQILWCAHENNIASNKFAKKCGFTYAWKKHDKDGSYTVYIITNPSKLSGIGESAIDNNNYQAALEVWNHLPKQDQLSCSPRGRYVDSPNLITRAVYKTTNGTPVGFADAYKYFGGNKNAFICIAVIPEYRGKGVSKELMNRLVHGLLNKYENMIWRTDKKNIASIKTAQSLGFTFYKQTKTTVTYIKKIR